jgi:hypothetical protein
MPTELKLNPAALGSLYEALNLCADTMGLNQDMCHESYDLAVVQARAAIALAESEPREKPLHKGREWLIDNGFAVEVFLEDQPPSYTLVDDIRKALANGGPLAEQVRQVLHESQSVEQPPSDVMTVERAREIAKKILHVVRPQYLRRACVESAVPILIAADHAARRETLEEVKRVFEGHDGVPNLYRFIERRLKELRHAG